MYQSNVPQMVTSVQDRADKWFAIVASDDLEVLFEDVQQQL